MVITKDYTHLLPYEKANRNLLPLEKDKDGRIPGLYFWGCNHDEWQMFENQYEYKIDVFLCKDAHLALMLIAAGFAELYVYTPETKDSLLLMKRIY